MALSKTTYSIIMAGGRKSKIVGQGLTPAASKTEADYMVSKTVCEVQSGSTSTDIATLPTPATGAVSNVVFSGKNGNRRANVRRQNWTTADLSFGLITASAGAAFFAVWTDSAGDGGYGFTGGRSIRN